MYRHGSRARGSIRGPRAPLRIPADRACIAPLFHKNILFPTVFSERSAAALPYAAAIARHYDAKIYLAHVVVSEEAVSSPAAVTPGNWTIAQQEMAILDRCDLLNGLQYEALVEEGELWDVLSKVMRVALAVATR